MRAVEAAVTSRWDIRQEQSSKHQQEKSSDASDTQAHTSAEENDAS